MADAQVAIVGGGIVGCSVLFELDRLGYSCVLLEKNDSLMSEASSGNSGMVHTGFDAPANSLELYCIKRCNQRAFPVFDKLGVPYRQNGSIMIAWNQDQVYKLESIRESSVAKGVEDICHLPLDELYRKEPHLTQQAKAALWVQKECIVEPCVYGLLLAHHARKNRAKIFTRCKVQSHEANVSGGSVLRTTHGPVSAKVVINCAGLYGDTVQEMAGIKTFKIRPRKGQYAVYGGSAGHLIGSSILPVPTEKTKGIIVFKTVYDNLVVGPTAEDVLSRQRPLVDPEITKRLVSLGRRTVPELNSYAPVGHYTGVRPATDFKDYQIKPYIDRNWITVGGIRSTGVSGSLGIGEYVAHQVLNSLKVEPIHGGTHTLEASDWNLLPNGTLSVDTDVYRVRHPITLYGMKEGNFNSRL